jgi:hypothetical protein
MEIDPSKIGETLSNAVPIFCLPEFIDKLPISLTFCFIYIIGCLIVIGLGLYFYLRRLNRRNGHYDDEQDTSGELSNSKILRGLFRRGQDTQMREISNINGRESGASK